MNHSGTFFTSRMPEEVFDLLANPEQFAPLLPDFESMAMLDRSRFLLRIAIALGELSGHANLTMELAQVEPPAMVVYRGKGMVAGSELNLGLEFRISRTEPSTEVNWRGEFSLDGGLSFALAGLIEPMGRKHFERMAERLCEKLNPAEPAVDVAVASEPGQKQSSS